MWLLVYVVRRLGHSESVPEAGQEVAGLCRCSGGSTRLGQERGKCTVNDGRRAGLGVLAIGLKESGVSGTRMLGVVEWCAGLLAEWGDEGRG